MKKILIVTGIYPPDIGGPATFVKDFFYFLKNKNDLVKVITLQNKQNIKNNEQNIIKINRDLNKFIRTIILIKTIRKYAKNVETVLCCGLMFETYIALLGLKNKKIYRFVGDSIWEKYLSSKKSNISDDKNINLFLKFITFFRNYILNKFDLIITPSNYLKNYIKKYIKSRNIKIINNFANFEKNKNNKFQEEISLKKRVNFIALSRLVKWKNIDILIESFKYLNEFNLHIYGSGPEEKLLKKKIKKLSLDNVFLYGSIKRSEVYQLLLKSDCFIQISSYEGMSFSVLEALALNKPMLLSNIEPNFETAKSAAIYVNQKSISNVIATLKLFKSPKIRKIISDNAKNTVCKLYNKEKILEKYYNEL